MEGFSKCNYFQFFEHWFVCLFKILQQENYLLLYRALELMSGESCFNVLPSSSLTSINNIANGSHNSLNLPNGNAISPIKQNGVLISQS